MSQNRNIRKYVPCRKDPNFLRNGYLGENPWDIPWLAQCTVSDTNIEFLSYNSAVRNDTKNRHKTIHFFKDDKSFEYVYRNPSAAMEKLAQYKHVLTPDFSLYNDLPLALQIHNVFRNRWCGRKWQENGISVIPTVSWSTKESFEFAFLGLQKGTAVAVSTLGNRKCKDSFMLGYNEMLERLNPSIIYCFCKPFDEMQGNVVFVDYQESMRRMN